MRESKFVVLGAGGVGKTSLVIRFLNDAFSSTYKPTVEDCYQHTIQLPDGISHTVEILDTAGSHHFPAMRELSIRSGRGFLIVYSVDSLQSFREAVQLYELIIDIRDTAFNLPTAEVGIVSLVILQRSEISLKSISPQYLPPGAQVPVVLVGNKSDLEIHRQVSHETAAQKASEALSGCPFFEASAKFDINVKEVFLELLQIAREHEEAQEAMLEEQDLFRRKSRMSKRLSRKLSCFNNMAFALKKSSPNRSMADVHDIQDVRKESEKQIKCTRNFKENQKCVLI